MYFTIPPPPRYGQSILDYGCGIGMNIPYLRQYFPAAKLFGCDVSKESIRLAKSQIDYCQFDVIETPKDIKMYENKIDCVFISTVLHHIEPNEHKVWLKALYDAMKEGSYMVIFEHNIFNPLTRRFVEKIPMDKDATMLKAGYCKKMVQEIFGRGNEVKLRYTYFFPWRNKIFTTIEHSIAWLPLGAQYYVAARK
ncbi:MAG: class I SAM-dependent methyltransferase [Treponema sp.]|jgi:trans-aconitate methyltransferase|nr:class I SAM-dependent methyltransferase [Treponema sp.]